MERSAGAISRGWVCLIPLPGYRDVELGYRFRSGAWGRGYAFEASRALVPFAFGELALPHLVAVIHPGNERSLHLIARLGFTDAGWREAYGKHLASSRSRGRAQVRLIHS